MEESARRIRRPGSVRLSDAQYQEMDQLGIENESAYVKYKLGHAKQHLKVIKQHASEPQKNSIPQNTTPQATPTMASQLIIQGLEFKNEQLEQQLAVLEQTKDQALHGIHTQVGNLLKEELQRRDFEELQKETSQQKKDIEKLEKALTKSKTETEEKEAEIKSLLKKLGFIELGKTLLPGAIQGLAKRFPNQMQGLASTLGAIGADASAELPNALSEEAQHLLQIATYFKELFSESQFEKMVQLVIKIGEGMETDTELLDKVMYYVNKMHQSS